MSAIIQLLVISTIAFTAQSAQLPRSTNDCKSVQSNILAKAKTDPELQNQTLHLYCVALALFNTVGRNETALQDVRIPEITMSNIERNEIISYFSYGCKNFIMALSFKHQLQEYLFNQTDTTAISQYIRPLYSILVYLQTLANILDDIEFNKRSSRCVKLTATEYKMMYHIQYKDTSFVESLKKKANDMIDNKYYEDNSLENTAPSVDSCNVFHPSLNCL